MTQSLPKRSRGLNVCFESGTVCATLILSVFLVRSVTLLGKVKFRMPALWPQVWPAVVLKGPCSVASSKLCWSLCGLRS